MIMKKNYFFALALAALVSCSSDDFVGEESVREANEQAAISFSSGIPAFTRADKTGSAAATDLSNQFIVWGEKSEASGAAATTGNLVFKNYLVDWVNNSAYTTTSNTKGWEYVGLKLNDGTASPATTTYSTHISPNSGTDAQTIKYWDFGATSYTFTAVSALPADITEGKVTITKTESGSTVYDKGYTVALTANAHLDNLFFSERQPITKSANTDRTQANKYGGNVTFRFHNMASKVRVAMYETIPGYSVTITKFSVDNDGADPAFSAMTDDVSTNFAANLQNCASGKAGTLTVKYVSSGTTENHPTVSFDGTKDKVLTLGTNLKANTLIGETTTGATYDKSDKTYTSVFPNETNTQNLKLKLSYKLTAPVTNEVINVTDATAEIPANYLKWKPGFAYTYIFKISDNTNGSSGIPGTDPAGLYPITFDAVEMIAEDGNAEYITTVSEPSITTFGTVTNAGKTTYVSGGSDYASGTAVYATVMEGSSLATLSASNMQLYTVTTSDADNFPITEASVAEALIEGPTLNAAQATAAKIKLPTNPALTYQNTVPAEDGTNINMDGTNNKAATFTTAATTTYALVYQKTAATYTVSGSTYADETAFNNAGTLYTTEGCTTVATWGDSSTTYYKRTAVSSKGEYVVKIVTCP